VTNQQKWLAVGGVLFAVVLGVAGCGGGGDDEETTSSSTTLVATTLAPATTADTTPVTVGIICNVPEDAATTLFNAWTAGDQAAASRCATPEAVGTLFAHPGAGAQWTFQGCNGGNDPGVPICQYSYEGGAANFTENGSEATGWKVVSVGYIAD
jgi:hypothetical protein